MEIKRAKEKAVEEMELVNDELDAVEREVMEEIELQLWVGYG